MNFLNRLFARCPPLHVADIEHPVLGTLEWDGDIGFWRTEQNKQSAGVPIPVCLWGDAKHGPSDKALALILPHVDELPMIVEASRNYLVNELSAKAKRPVDGDELGLIDLCAYAGKEPHMDVTFEWADEPDWILRVSLENGRPDGWGFDD